MGNLSDKQKKFVAEYLRVLCATQAAINAGYSKKTAKQQGSRLLTHDEIAAAIKRGRKRAEKKAEVTLDDVLAEYKRIAFTGMSKFVRINEHNEPEVDLSQCSPNDLDLIQESTIEAFTDTENEGARQVRRVKIKTIDRLKALETLGKHLGLGNKREEETQDRLTLALIEISKRGSAAPIATARRRELE